MYIFLVGWGLTNAFFKKLAYPHAYKSIFIQWLTPFKNETLVAYSKRISEQVLTNEPCIFIGVSFGGMVAVEVSKLIKPQKLILLSSIATHAELPFYYSMIGNLGILKIIPMALLKQANFVTYYMFGVKLKDEKILLKNILTDTDSYFLAWALQAIVSWKNAIRPSSYWHLHALDDKILPFRFCNQSCIPFETGGHFMVYNQSEKVNQTLVAILSS